MVEYLCLLMIACVRGSDSLSGCDNAVAEFANDMFLLHNGYLMLPACMRQSRCEIVRMMDFVSVHA